MFSIFDFQMMQRAINLTILGVYTATPNPSVGCVITKDDHIVGEGCHLRAGEPHAEVHALNAAGKRAKNATAYVTLEPCSHYGRTPPCTLALLEAGVNRVVCAMVDPNPKVAGRGIQCLRDANIQVDIGLMEVQAEALNPGFIKVMKTGLPFVQLKLAASLDGRTALSNGRSKWITSFEARKDVQTFRSMSDAILSTRQTVVDDDPSLNVRWDQLPSKIQANYEQASLRQPVCVILDSKGMVPSTSRLFSFPGKKIILTANPAVLFTQKNIEIVVIPKASNGLDLNVAFRVLASKGINHIWVEAGPTLAGSLLTEELVDELIVYQAPKLMGSDSRALVNLVGYTEMEQVLTFSLTDVCQIGSDIRLRMYKQ
ncbi:bifunctional diaminohydroxyphosphoribosylaminopyrimidine deaminase/5-amino-6-(5-phosphoribosylamino)uracil reductase RibD [Candidatus Enterovibrio altilux]|nr:bifunctional diaminohydroxyphosphoribosylaminopyrimidine deaminase/5-amino-6-(5-phosphoribosylamino)uracil reductase RibD [Candidatus Enterovibrio luxaltus]